MGRYLRALMRMGSDMVAGLTGRSQRKLRRQVQDLDARVARLTKLTERLAEAIQPTSGTPSDGKGEGGVDARLSGIERRLRRVDQLLRRKLRVRLARVERDVQTLVRTSLVDADDLEYPFKLSAERFGVLSQNEEDGILQGIFRRIGVGPRHFVEIGCGTNGGNSGFLARELGWEGLMIDANPDRVRRAQAQFGTRVRCEQAMVTRDNVNDLIRGAGLEGEVDLLSIDIDGNDLWVWDAIDACNPRVVAIEYNALFGAERAVTIPYSPDFDRSAVPGNAYYGASLEALARVGSAKGQRLVIVEPRGVNAFFVRQDLAGALPTLAVPHGFRARREQVRRGIDLYALIEAHGLPLVEIPENGRPSHEDRGS